MFFAHQVCTCGKKRLFLGPCKKKWVFLFLSTMLPEIPVSQNGTLGFVALDHLWLSHWAWEAPALASWVAEIMRVSHGQALAALNQIINFCLLPEVVYFPLFFYTHLVSTLKEKKTVYCMFYLPLNLRAVFLACKPFFVLQLRVIGTGKQAAQDTLFLLWLVI